MDKQLNPNLSAQCGKQTIRVQPFRSMQCTAHQQRSSQLHTPVSSDHTTAGQVPSLSRRVALASVPAALLAFGQIQPAYAFRAPPQGYRLHEDKLDGYSFFYPQDWLPVTTSGNDVFFRNPFDIEENVFVDISSPSSSKFSSVADLGPPDAAAKKLLDQYLEEFMSTRLGVKRTAETVSATSQTGADGKQYYVIQLRAQSYASRNQLAVTQNEVDEGVVLEWDRRYVTVLGVANKRLYQLRLQVANEKYDARQGELQQVLDSFQCKEVDV